MTDLRMKMDGPVFQANHRVIYGVTDAAGVVYNANYLRYFEMGRSEMMRAIGMPYRDIEERGLILPVTESYLRYKASARYDDLLTVNTCLVEVKKVSCRFHYRVTRRVEGERDQLLVKGFTVHACITRNGKLALLPDDVREKMLEIAEGTGEAGR